MPVGSAEGPPTMMTFKAFLAAQDDSITVDDAILKYNEYKLEFRRQQLNEFFVAHKDEEWYVFYSRNLRICDLLKIKLKKRAI